ncbi:Cyanovirin-N [Niveomyces insectorum RCEF 264]|uniref:Cyanovirin-N n=1 Tax=Niveomyces insectorum RCEF 264 TaxID=1081102 RepID=A0A167UNH2_9HYPO|nr:Cyanovirin-N [Niveomyces insectorum RCEF 264]
MPRHTTSSSPSRRLPALFVLLGLVTVALLARPARAAGNFTRSCAAFTVHAGATGQVDLLSASCRADDDDGDAGTGNSTGTGSSGALHALHNSTLDLNLCLGIDQTTGQLVWSLYGKFINYCSHCVVTHRTELGCACATLSGVRRNATIDLNEGVTSVNGTLYCADNGF